jgi:transcriptional regulator with XRE-family HTH domain
MPARKEPRIALSQVVRQLRSAQEISQEELAYRAGVHRNWVGMLERGEVNPTWISTKRVASGLGITHASLAAMEEAFVKEHRQKEGKQAKS